MGITWIAEKGNTLKVGVFEEGKLASRVAFENFSSDAIPTVEPEEIMLTGSGGWTDRKKQLFTIYAEAICLFSNTEMVTH